MKVPREIAAEIGRLGRLILQGEPPYELGCAPMTPTAVIDG